MENQYPLLNYKIGESNSAYQSRESKKSSESLSSNGSKVKFYELSLVIMKKKVIP